MLSRVPYIAVLAMWALSAREEHAAPSRAPLIDSHRDAAPVAIASPTPPAFSSAPIAGWTIDDNGAPLAGVRVRVANTEIAADSDASGAFRLAMPAGDHVLAFDGLGVSPAELAWRDGDRARPIVLARRAKLVVRVVAGGAPAGDANVALSDGSGGVVTARADRDGVARFDDLRPGPYEVWAQRDGTVSPLARIEDAAAQHDDIALALAPAATLHGRLVGGASLVGAIVEVVPLDVDHAVRVAAVEPDGRFAIAGLPDGRWRIETNAPGYVATGTHVVAVHGDSIDAAVPVVRAGSIAGTVVDPSGAPLANVRLVLREQGAPTIGGAVDDARALIAGRARWVHPLAGARAFPVRDAARFGASRPGVRPAECGQGHCGIDIGSQRGAIIHAAGDGTLVGVYRDIHGEAGRMVAIDHGGGLHTMYMHMEQIRAGLEVGQRVRAGDALGTLGSTGFALDNPHLHFAVTQERDGRTWYVDPEPMLARAVVLATPRSIDLPAPTPAIDARVAATPREVAASITTAPHDIVTDAHGRFRIDGVAPGTYVVVAFAPGLAPGASPTVAVHAGADAADVAVTLRPGAMVRGRVVGPNGPLDGALVTAATGFGEASNKIAMTFTDRQGEFVLRALTDKVTLDVSAAGYGEQQRAIAIADAAAQRREDFALVIENAQLRGQVVAPDGGAPGAVAVRIVDGPSRRTVVTDASGRFTIDHVADGAYVIEVSSPDHPSARVAIRGGEYKDVRLERGGRARIEIRDARARAPLAGVRVDASGPGGAMIARTTDATGAIELRGLAVGEWTFVARGKGFATTRRALAIAADGAPTIALELPLTARVAGVVRDRFGRRVAAARVSFGDARTTTDRDGNFHFDDATPGAGSIEAEADGARGALAIELVAGDDRANLTVELAP
jgi:murein DD-endopeptidase MepM/ murein hydrolase activator NlpD/protocatechuate 3,4-dioxygenase beta subunit